VGFPKPVLDVLEPKLEGTLMQLLPAPHQALRRDSARDTSLRNLIYDHGIEDRLHHLGAVGVLSVSRSHAKLEPRTEDEVILTEEPRTLGRGLPQRRSKGFSSVFGRHLGASEIQKANHFFLLFLSSLKDWRMGRR